MHDHIHRSHEAKCGARSFFVALGVVAFGLHWIWEMLQMSNFQEMAGRSFAETAVPCAFASMGDVVLTFGVYGVGAIASRSLRWGMGAKWHVYVSAGILGALTAVVVEWLLIGSGRWTYLDRMPIIPVLGVGLWPVLQLSLLVPITFYIAAWWACEKAPKDAVPGEPRSGHE